MYILPLVSNKNIKINFVKQLFLSYRKKFKDEGSMRLLKFRRYKQLKRK